jgi:pilus assembly protein CpaF
MPEWMRRRREQLDQVFDGAPIGGALGPGAPSCLSDPSNPSGGASEAELDSSRPPASPAAGQGDRAPAPRPEPATPQPDGGVSSVPMREGAVPTPAGGSEDARALRLHGLVGRPEEAAKRLRFWTEESSPEDEEDRGLLRQIRRRLFDQTEGLPDREREALARQIAWEMAGTISSRGRQERLVAEALSSLGGRLGPLEPLVRDTTVAEILINAPDEVYVERHGRLERQDLRFRGDREVRALVEGIAAWAGRKFDWASPVLDCHLQDGSRLAAVRWPVALRGTAVAIRKFPMLPTWSDLIAMGALPTRDSAALPGFLRTTPYPRDVDVADFLAWAVRRRLNMVVCGGTSSGKTTFLNALMDLVSPNHRVVIIEDSAELQPPSHTHVVRLERRPPNLEGEGEVSLWALLIASLRLRPDIIVVGECRKNETGIMLEAMTTGHPGSMTTVHADSPVDALRRMVRMVRQDQPDIPSVELREYIASAVQLIVQFRRDESHAAGLRTVERVAAVDGVDPHGQFIVRDLYRWQGGRFAWTEAVPGWAEPQGVT